jgi:AcrR family transcriptional regulator
MTRRAEAVDATHRRIVDAARDLLAQGTVLTLAAVAVRAGVSRPTVYERVGNLSGLLRAVIDDAQERAGVAEAIAASKDPDAVAAMRKWLEHAARFWRREAAVLAPAWEQARASRELAALFQAQEMSRRRRANAIARRLVREGLLRRGVSAESATDLLWLLSGLSCYQQLRNTGDRLPALLADWAGAALLGED